MEEILKNPVVKAWADCSPITAYLSGLSNYVGKVAIETDEWIKERLATIKSLKERGYSYRILDMMALWVEYDEPEFIVEGIFDTFFGYMVKEGVIEDHIISLSTGLRKNLKVLANRFKKQKFTFEHRVLTSMNGIAAKGIISIVKKQIKSEKALTKLEELEKFLDEYIETFGDANVKTPDQKFILEYMEKHEEEEHINRSDIYPKILKDGYGYPYTADEIVALASKALDEDLPTFQRLLQEIKDVLGDPAKELPKKFPVKREKVVDIINEWRNKTRKLAEKLIEFPEHYDVRVTETPEFLRPLIPSAAVMSYDTLTDKPFILFFATPSDTLNLVDLIQLIFHEEYGHAVNELWVAQNKKLDIVYKLYSTLVLPITEAIAFGREYEFLELLESDNGKKWLRENFDEPDLFLLASRYLIYHWRIIRYIRAYSDPLINMGKKTITEVVRELSEKTKIDKVAIFSQLINFQGRPGYAPSYFIGASELRKIQKTAAGEVDIRKFNTIAASAGYPSLTEWLASLRKLVRAH